MSVIGDKIRELVEMADDERGDFFPDLLALDEAGDTANSVTGAETAAKIAELEAVIAELRTQNAALATHNHALLNAVPSAVEGDELVDDDVDEDEDPLDALFGEPEDD